MLNAKHTLLLVDDEPEIRIVLTHILTELGHEVRTAEDGFSALKELRGWEPEILLSDLNMPGMSGFELLSVVRRRLPAIYVIASSGAYLGSAVPRGIAADAFYQKASGMDRLMELLETAKALDGPPQRVNTAMMPIWISRDALDADGGRHLVINCPHCLRNSTQHCVETLLTIHETKCLYCEATIVYAMIRPMGQRSAHTNQPGLGPMPVPVAERGRSVAKPLQRAG
jgi:CheY-like chemotaxis protein